MIAIQQHEKSVIIRALSKVDSYAAGMVGNSTLTRRTNEKGEDILWIETHHSAVMPRSQNNEWGTIVFKAAKTFWPSCTGVGWGKAEAPPSSMPSDDQVAREKEQRATAVAKQIIAGVVVAFVDESGRKWESGWIASTGALRCDVCAVTSVNLWRNLDNGTFACERHLTYR